MFFCVLHLCVQSVETAPKLNSEKHTAFVSVFTVFLRAGGVTIYVFIDIRCPYIYMYRYGGIYTYTNQNPLSCRFSIWNPM